MGDRGVRDGNDEGVGEFRAGKFLQNHLVDRRSAEKGKNEAGRGGIVCDADSQVRISVGGS